MTRLGKVDRPSGLVVQACWVEVPRELLAVGLATVGGPRHLCGGAGGTALVAANGGRVGGRAGGKFNSSKQRQSAQTLSRMLGAWSGSLSHWCCGQVIVSAERRGGCSGRTASIEATPHAKAQATHA